MNEIIGQVGLNRNTGNSTAIIVHGSLRIVLTLQSDYAHDFAQGRGKLCSDYEMGAVKFSNPTYRPCDYQFFVPDESLESSIKALRDSGMELQEAVKQVNARIQKDIAICLDPELQNMGAYGVTAEVYTEDVRLGINALWGVEIEGNPTEDVYIQEIAEECIEAAVQDAKKTLEKLKNIEIN
jgi:hypothetical protein